MFATFLSILFSISLQAENVAVNYEGNPHVAKIVPQQLQAKISRKVGNLKPEDDGGCSKKYGPELERLSRLREEISKKYHDEKAAYGKKHPEIKDWTDSKNHSPKMIELDKKVIETLNAITDMRKKIEKCRLEFETNYQVETTIPVYEAPDRNSSRLGQLRYVFKGAHTVEMTFTDSKGKVQESQVDLYDYETGGSKHTVLAQKGNWFQLPKNPFPRPAWIQISDGKNVKAESLPSLGPIKIDTPTYKGSVVLKNIENGFYIAQKYEMPDLCTEEYDEYGNEIEPTSPSPPKKVEIVKIPLSELLDENKHVVNVSFLGKAPCEDL